MGDDILSGSDPRPSDRAPSRLRLIFLILQMRLQAFLQTRLHPVGTTWGPQAAHIMAVAVAHAGGGDRVAVTPTIVATLPLLAVSHVITCLCGDCTDSCMYTDGHMAVP
jgi:hypothetical protein